MKFYIIAGEASGDLHASNLVRAMKRKYPALEFRGWGGDKMSAQGVEIIKHYRELAFMGFVEVIANLRTILKNLDQCKKDILGFKPDAIILVDYPGFNLRIAEFAHQHGIKVFYYISPQVWAWKQSRVHKIKRIVDRMFCILPFEKDFYKKFEYDVSFVGHPLLDVIAEEEKNNENIQRAEKKTIALLPGSRRQEISNMLPVMLETTRHFKEFNFVVAAAPSVPVSFYEGFTQGYNVIVSGQTYDLLRRSEAALVTSGTATLETALFEVPLVVCYKGNTLSYFIARKLVKVKYISLVNLVLEKQVVKELIQSDLNVENLKTELHKVLFDKEARGEMKQQLLSLKQKLGSGGASETTANEILDMMKV